MHGVGPAQPHELMKKKHSDKALYWLKRRFLWSKTTLYGRSILSGANRYCLHIKTAVHVLDSPFRVSKKALINESTAILEINRLISDSYVGPTPICPQADA